MRYIVWFGCDFASNERWCDALFSIIVSFMHIHAPGTIFSRIAVMCLCAFICILDILYYIIRVRNRNKVVKWVPSCTYANNTFICARHTYSIFILNANKYNPELKLCAILMCVYTIETHSHSRIDASLFIIKEQRMKKPNENLCNFKQFAACMKIFRKC